MPHRFTQLSTYCSKQAVAVRRRINKHNVLFTIYIYIYIICRRVPVD